MEQRSTYVTKILQGGLPRHVFLLVSGTHH
jgi:hypothetical protein